MTVQGMILSGKMVLDGNELDKEVLKTSGKAIRG